MSDFDASEHSGDDQSDASSESNEEHDIVDKENRFVVTIIRDDNLTDEGDVVVILRLNWIQREKMLCLYSADEEFQKCIGRMIKENQEPPGKSEKLQVFRCIKFLKSDSYLTAKEVARKLVNREIALNEAKSDAEKRTRKRKAPDDVPKKLQTSHEAAKQKALRSLTTNASPSPAPKSKETNDSLAVVPSTSGYKPGKSGDKRKHKNYAFTSESGSDACEVSPPPTPEKKKRASGIRLHPVTRPTGGVNVLSGIGRNSESMSGNIALVQLRNRVSSVEATINENKSLLKENNTLLHEIQDMVSRIAAKNKKPNDVFIEKFTLPQPAATRNELVALESKLAQDSAYRNAYEAELRKSLSSVRVDDNGYNDFTLTVLKKILDESTIAGLVYVGNNKQKCDKAFPKFKKLFPKVDEIIIRTVRRRYFSRETDCYTVAIKDIERRLGGYIASQTSQKGKDKENIPSKPKQPKNKFRPVLMDSEPVNLLVSDEEEKSDNDSGGASGSTDFILPTEQID